MYGHGVISIFDMWRRPPRLLQIYSSVTNRCALLLEKGQLTFCQVICRVSG